MHTFRDLIVWQKAVDLVEEIYRLTTEFPKEEQYGLCGQMRRAAVSIPSNIAEGRLREGDKEFRQFLLMAYGSAGELETQIEIAKRLPKMNMCNYIKVESLLLEIKKMLNVLIGKFSTPKA
ncbi:MAG: four helix bundle protein [bacterium]